MLYEEIIKIAPMLPILHNEPFDDKNYVYQVKWDGVRIIANINSNKVELINRNYKYKTLQYPELLTLSNQVNAKNTVLDGEVVVLKAGKPSFESVIRRDKAKSKEKINHLKSLFPITYLVFDILAKDNKPLHKTPLIDRKKILTDTLIENQFVQLVEDFNSGIKLFEAIKGQELEGIVAKKKTSLYIPGKKHKDWFKIKYRRNQLCVVAGYTCRSNIVNSLLLGAYRDNELYYIGRVGSGLTVNEWNSLTNELPKLVITNSPFVNYQAKPNKTFSFVKPVLVVNVSYVEWTESMHLRSPVIVNFTNNNPSECLL
ncbi:ATP-dependent DNA ligase [Candidatus Syntrophocurvum alkaliphilum]|uniref:DNA ligase (ATP) n=1 Tax=Candidatus Syntrophocurvum alkaliphilum TaxID=2293317 RepID=A0A6I6D8P3_9FIRM|nr:non-homologous end-joining DNA ligase [Candidatus Syntrophocurvum alkaliphilum]QGT98887.1 ATP-dependent DNA ligase [Candidatus Syntrophocurvum alkaliphilum]